MRGKKAKAIRRMVSEDGQYSLRTVHSDYTLKKVKAKRTGKFSKLDIAGLIGNTLVLRQSCRRWLYKQLKKAYRNIPMTSPLFTKFTQSTKGGDSP